MVLEKNEAVQEAHELRKRLGIQQVQEKAHVQPLDGWDECGVCLEVLEPLSRSNLTAKQQKRGLAQLGCMHTFHFDCLMLACASKGHVQCPSCRYVEPATWDLLSKDCNSTYAPRSRADAYEPDEEDRRDTRDQRQAFLRMLLSHAIGATEMPAQSQTSTPSVRRERDPGTAVLLPVPVVPVDLFHEMHAFTAGHKRAIFMPGSVQPAQRRPTHVPLTQEQQQEVQQLALRAVRQQEEVLRRQRHEMARHQRVQRRRSTRDSDDEFNFESDSDER